MYSHTDMYATAHSNIIQNSQKCRKKSKGPFSGKLINSGSIHANSCKIHAIEYYLAIKRIELLMHACLKHAQ